MVTEAPPLPMGQAPTFPGIFGTYMRAGGKQLLNFAR